MGKQGEPSGAGGIPRILQDLADGGLDPTEAEAVVAWLDASAEAPPSWVTNRAIRIGRRAEADRPAGRTPMRWLQAALVFDSRRSPRLAGARAAAAGLEAPRLRYEAGGAEIDLELGEAGAGGRTRVLGQVTAGEPDLAGARVIAEGRGGRAEAEVDDLGQFVLDGLGEGAYRLTVGLRYDLIEIPTLEL